MIGSSSNNRHIDSVEYLLRMTSRSAVLDGINQRLHLLQRIRQVRRDRRTLAMMIVLPVILLIVFGYAASFDVSKIPTVAAGPQAAALVHSLGKPFDLVAAAPAGLPAGRAWGRWPRRSWGRRPARGRPCRPGWR